MDMIELTSAGDNRVDWDTDDPDMVAGARAAFDTYKAKGLHIFHVDEETDERSTKRMETFAPLAGAFIALRQLRGG